MTAKIRKETDEKRRQKYEQKKQKRKDTNTQSVTGHRTGKILLRH